MASLSPFRFLPALALVLLAACPGSPPDKDSGCSCDIKFNGAAASLACGEETCLNGERFHCGESAAVERLGTCSPTMTTKDAGTSTSGPDAGRTDAGMPPPKSDGGMPPPSSPWTQVAFNSSADLTSVSTSSDIDNTPLVYLVGGGGTCFTYRRMSFEPCNQPSSTARLTSVSAYSDQSVMMGADDGTLTYRFEIPTLPVEWRQVSAGKPIRAVSWATVDRSYVFGDSGLAVVYDLSRKPAASKPLTGLPATATITAAAATTGNRPDSLWVVGSGGLIAKLPDIDQSLAFTPETSGVTSQLNALVIENELGKVREVVAVGNGGVILSRSEAGVWTRQTSGVTNNLYGVFEGIGGMYAVGAEGVVLFRKDNTTTWTRENSGVTKTLRAGDMRFLNPQFDFWVVGDTGTVLYR